MGLNVPKHVLLGTLKEATAYIRQVRAMRRASPVLAREVDAYFTKQAYGLSDYWEDVKQVKPLQTAGLGALVGGGVGALQERLRGRPRNRNYLKAILGGAGYGAAIGGGAGLLNKYVPDVIAQMTGSASKGHPSERTPDQGTTIGGHLRSPYETTVDIIDAVTPGDFHDVGLKGTISGVAMGGAAAGTTKALTASRDVIRNKVRAAQIARQVDPDLVGSAAHSTQQVVDDAILNEVRRTVHQVTPEPVPTRGGTAAQGPGTLINPDGTPATPATGGTPGRVPAHIDTPGITEIHVNVIDEMHSTPAGRRAILDLISTQVPYDATHTLPDGRTVTVVIKPEHLLPAGHTIEDIQTTVLDSDGKPRPIGGSAQDLASGRAVSDGLNELGQQGHLPHARHGGNIAPPSQAQGLFRHGRFFPSRAGNVALGTLPAVGLIFDIMQAAQEGKE